MFSQPFFSPPPPQNIPHFPHVIPPFPTHYPRNSISPFPHLPPTVHHPGKHRKQLSIGGPPKAVLGGPQRKLSPLPPSLTPAISKPKKLIVNLPKETLPSERDGKPSTRPEWARYPLDNSIYHDLTVSPVEATSRDIYPQDISRRLIPDTIDVFLPTQHAWDALKQQVIEEKLEQLGVERGSGSNVPHIYAPHARAASISSPADPALLMFKLNKLHQQQQQDGLMSPSLTSPQPPFSTTSPRFPPSIIHPVMLPPGSITNRHGHTLSLAQPPSYHPSTFDSLVAPPPEHIPMTSYHTALSPAPRPSIIIPQSKPSIVPLSPGQFPSPLGGPAVPSLSAVHPRTRMDFARGFGLETPEEAEEEEEEEEEEKKQPPEEATVEEHTNAEEVPVNVDDGGAQPLDAATTTGPHSSRHESKMSASLSVPSRIRTPVVVDMTVDMDMDVAGEWTGSEDICPSESSDNESIGEWSNPSDEERARQGRADRRMRRRLTRRQLLDKPRRIPNFPKPPGEPTVTSIARHQHRLSSPQPHVVRTNGYRHEEGDEDIISNPSEEARLQQDEEYLVTAAGNLYDSQVPNPSPPPKHSRSSTGQYSAHDPAKAHSRNSSDTFGVHFQRQQTQPLSLAAALNPFAKPFVFGIGRQTQPVAPQQHLAAPPNAPRLSHSPLPSIGSGDTGPHATNAPSLNVSAPEFRPAGFTFRPPPGVPQMPMLSAPSEAGLEMGLGSTAEEIMVVEGDSLSPPGRPLSSITAAHVDQVAPERQGREKRQRRNSSSGDLGNAAVFDEGDSLRSFRFPADMESPKSLRSMRRSMSDASVHHRVMSSDRETNRGTEAAPFPYATFSALPTVPYIPLPKEQEPTDEGEKDMEVEEDVARINQEESTFADDSTAKNESRLSAREQNQEGDDDDRDEGVSLFRSRKRPPLPLDFTAQSTRKNTVPAGLFKALASANSRGDEERTRKAVRSRLSSRDLFDENRKPSLDDVDVPYISNTFSRGRFVTDPANNHGVQFDKMQSSEDEDANVSDAERDRNAGDEDIFSSTRQQQHRRRGSSLPSDLHDMDDHETSRALVESPGLELTTREDMRDFEERLIVTMEEKFAALEHVLSERRGDGPSTFSSKTETMIADMVSLFRAQLQESAARSLEDSQMDARGEMDFQLIKDIIDEGHKELAVMLRKELKEATEQQGQAQQVRDAFIGIIEDVGSRTVSAIVETIADFSARQEVTVNRLASAPARERDTLVEMVVNSLSPLLASTRADPIDYEFLTNQLAQAVKPHISQLIDLASDKRETASLIVDRILPLLPSQGPMDVETLTFQLITEVRRAIAPIDAHEIKEQVADLVIERLDSRLAVRDKVLNIDAITMRVKDSVSGAVEPMTKVLGVVETALVEQRAASQGHLEELSLKITELPAKLAERMDGLADAQDKILSKLGQPTPKTDLNEDVKDILANVEELISQHKTSASRDEEVLLLNKEILDKLLSLPDALLTASNVLSNTHSELVASLESSKREIEELRKLNTEYQVQMTKARGAHGQVRVEKDALNEKLTAAEADRDRLRAQVQEIQSEASVQAIEVSSLKLRNTELEEALAQALGRLQAVDVSSSTNQQRLADLEQANHDLKDEKQALQATVESLNMQLNYANREKDTAIQTLEGLQKKNEELALQQSHWDSLRLASEKIDALTNLIGQADNEELKELRATRDRANGLEADHATLQKRFKDLEIRLANSEKASTTARQSLTQAQQRSTEWERHAQEAEGQLEYTKTRLEQTEQTQSQLEADLSLVRLQLEEGEADSRLLKDREVRLREQIADLEAKVVRLQSEPEKAKTPKLTTVTAVAPSPFRAATNGGPPRPQSRTSTIYDMRSPTPSQRPVSQMSYSSGTPPSGSVWDSVHAPKQPYPTPWSSNQLKRYPYLGPSTPRGPQAQHYSRPAPPSPTPSTVSVAPTQGEDGWWSIPSTFPSSSHTSYTSK